MRSVYKVLAYIVAAEVAIPLIALVLLVCAFFAKVPGGVKWAGIVFLLVAVQVTLGTSGKSIPALGALHGLNALLLFSAAVYTGRRTRSATAAPATESRRIETPV
jgi:heme A synthase